MVNSRIGYTLHHVRQIISNLICITSFLTICFQVYAIEQNHRGLCPYDNKRYLLADLPDERTNSNTNPYGHCDLAAKEHVMADQPKPCAEFIIRQSEKRFARKHARVTMRLDLAGAMEIEKAS